MEILLTYDVRWARTPKGHTAFWASLDTVEYVAGLLDAAGIAVTLIEADEGLTARLAAARNRSPRALVFWLNEFTPTSCGPDVFTVSVVEQLGMMHTGPTSAVLATGLDKEATKQVFRRLGLPTPPSSVLRPGDDCPVDAWGTWQGHVIVKPLLQGNSRGMDASSVVPAADAQAIRQRVQRVHRQFNEPAIVERYIGGQGAREFTVPLLISHDRRIAPLPITEIDLSQIPACQGQFRFLTHDIKDEKYYLKTPADLPADTTTSIHRDVARIIREMGCTDMVRVDIRADATGLYYLEVNANPGKNRFSYLTTSAYSLGLEYGQIIAFIPYQAMLKHRLPPPPRLEQLVRPVMALFDRFRPSPRRRSGKPASLHRRPAADSLPASHSLRTDAPSPSH